MGEAHVPAEQPEAGQEPRVPPPDVDPGRTGHHQGPSPQGPRSAVGLIWRITDRSTFSALRRSRHRARSSTMTLTWLPSPTDDPPRVGFAVGRRVGNAVIRNRMKRRLRAVFREEADDLRPGAYFVDVRPAAVELDASSLRAEVHTLVAEATATTVEDRS